MTDSSGFSADYQNNTDSIKGVSQSVAGVGSVRLRLATVRVSATNYPQSANCVTSCGLLIVGTPNGILSLTVHQNINKTVSWSISL